MLKFELMGQPVNLKTNLYLDILEKHYPIVLTQSNMNFSATCHGKDAVDGILLL